MWFSPEVGARHPPKLWGASALRGLVLPGTGTAQSMGGPLGEGGSWLLCATEQGLSLCVL